MNDICKCGHDNKYHSIIEGCTASKGQCPCFTFRCDHTHIKNKVERMADLVSAAVRWRNSNSHCGMTEGCDCAICALIRAVDRYIEANKEK